MPCFFGRVNAAGFTLVVFHFRMWMVTFSDDLKKLKKKKLFMNHLNRLFPCVCFRLLGGGARGKTSPR